MPSVRGPVASDLAFLVVAVLCRSQQQQSIALFGLVGGSALPAFGVVRHVALIVASFCVLGVGVVQ